MMQKILKFIPAFPCVFKLVTNLYCPACGGTRAALAFLRLDFLTSLKCNPTFAYLVLIAGWLGIGALVRKTGKGTGEIFRFRMWMLYVGLAVFFGFGILRDIGLNACNTESSAETKKVPALLHYLNTFCFCIVSFHFSNSSIVRGLEK